MSQDSDTLFAAGAKLTELGIDIIEGRITDAVSAGHQLTAILLTMIPVDQLKAFLTPEDKVFADLSVDIAEQIKLETEEP